MRRPQNLKKIFNSLVSKQVRDFFQIFIAFSEKLDFIKHVLCIISYQNHDNFFFNNSSLITILWASLVFVYRNVRMLGYCWPFCAKIAFQLFFKINVTLRMLASAPVLCPDPKEPTRSLSCLPQSEKDLKNMNVKFNEYYWLNNELEILPGWFASKLLAWKTIASKYILIVLN